MMSSRLWIPILLVAIVFTTFARVPRNKFVNYDDHVHVYKNPYLNPVTAKNVLHFWSNPFQKRKRSSAQLFIRPYEQLYSPLTFTAWAAIAKGTQLPAPVHDLDTGPRTLDARPFHIFSLVLHILNTLVVFAVLRVLINRDRSHDWAAVAGALVFGVHPVQVETVSWITGTNNLLSTFWAMCALWLYMIFARSNQSQTRRPAAAHLFYAGATLCFLLALLSKPSAVLLPVVAFLILRWKNWLALTQTLKTLAPWLGLAGACVLLNQTMQPPPFTEIVTPLWARPFIVGDALAFYLGKVLWPARLVSDYGRAPHLVMAQWTTYIHWLVPATLIVLAWLKRKAWPWLPIAVAIFMFAALPTSGIIPYYYHKHSTVADRYLYLSMFGVALLASGTLDSWFEFLKTYRPENRRMWLAVTAVLCALVTGALGVKSAQQTRTWANSWTLWSDLLAYDPHSWRAHTNLANLLRSRGDYKAAIPLYQAALRDNPNIPETYENLADVYVAQGRVPEAMQLYQGALRVDPGFIPARLNLASAYRSRGQIQQAAALYRELLKAHPDSSIAHYNLAGILARQGQVGPALEHFAAAVKIKPDDAESRNGFALALARAGRFEQAKAQWEEALRLDPEYSDAHINYGTLLAMSGNAPAAISHWKTALILNPKNPEVHHNLATALFSHGRKDEAIAHWKTALRLKPDYPAARRALQSAEQQHQKAPR
jgi:tetratricopeptide (TPR) repeat protein